MEYVVLGIFYASVPYLSIPEEDEEDV